MKRYDNVLNKKHARRHEQAKSQLTSPRIWALECQKVSRPSLVSNLNICNLQSLSSGLPISQSVSSTWAIKQLDANPLDISLAISIGVVIHFFPSLIAPSGRVTLKGMAPNNGSEWESALSSKQTAVGTAKTTKSQQFNFVVPYEFHKI